jgi:hypothetical protein
VLLEEAARTACVAVGLHRGRGEDRDEQQDEGRADERTVGDPIAEEDDQQSRLDHQSAAPDEQLLGGVPRQPDPFGH